MVAHAARSSAVVALAVACLFLCVADCSAQDSPKASPACSRERSRHARAVLDEFFHPVVDKNRFELPPACPFARAKDMYLEHERHKEVVRRTQYKSLYSDKTFKSEYYVDKHMDNEHSDKIPAGADVCLAEYCGVLRCDAFRGWRATDAKARFEHALDAIGLHAHEWTRPRWRARARAAGARRAVLSRPRPRLRGRRRLRGGRSDGAVSRTAAALRVPDVRWRRGDVPRDGGAGSENKHKRVFVWLVVLALAACYAAVASDGSRGGPGAAAAQARARRRRRGSREDRRQPSRALRGEEAETQETDVADVVCVSSGCFEGW